MSAASPIDPGQLCLECGLCCSGAVFTHVAVGPDDLERLRQAGQDVAPCSGRLDFPCRYLSGKACTVYPDRPSVCASYRCETLIAVQSGAMPLSAARERIGEVVALHARFTQTIPAGHSLDSARRLLDLDQPPAGMTRAQFAAMRLAFVALQAGIDHHIRRRGDEVVQFMAPESRD